MSSLFTVCKGFLDGVTPREAGEVVDATGWRNTNALVARHYLRPFVGEDVGCPYCDKFFESDQILDEHITSKHPKLLEATRKNQALLEALKQQTPPTPPTPPKDDPSKTSEDTGGGAGGSYPPEASSQPPATNTPEGKSKPAKPAKPTGK